MTYDHNHFNLLLFFLFIYLDFFIVLIIFNIPIGGIMKDIHV